MTEVLTQQTNSEDMLDLVNICLEAGQHIPFLLTDSAYAKGQMIEFGQAVINKHSKAPIELLVGDDVSGRIPTLVARKLLQQSHAAGLTEEAPPTVFMASGKFPDIAYISGDERYKRESAWQESLNDKARAIYANSKASNALIITESTDTGRSINRITTALNSAGIIDTEAKIASLVLWLRCKPITDLQAVGLVKRPGNAASFRRDDYDGERVRSLRQFLNAYSKDLFARIIDAHKEPTWDRP